VRRFDVALVRREGVPVAFANLWEAGTKRELSVDLMRFGPDAPRSAMDFLFVELMLWGRAQGYQWFNLGMAPLAGLEEHPLRPPGTASATSCSATASTSTTSKGCATTSRKFKPVWERATSWAAGGIALPRILLDVSR